VKVALVHDWLTGMRGGERVLEAVCPLFPEADLYTLFHLPGRVSPAIERMRIRTSWLQRLPGLAREHRYYLPLFPAAVRGFDLRGYDLILSLSHCVAKAARRPSGAVHVCYILSPMRYAWDQFEAYMAGRRASWLVRWAAARAAEGLRRWDAATAGRVDRYVAISRHVARRVERYYARVADVIYPPVDLDRFRLGTGPGDYYLVVSALVPYKRVDLAVEAFSRLGLPLRVVGDGPEARRLRALAGPSVAFLGWLPDPQVAEVLRDCRALVFPGEEDFGLAPLEAQACGRPVIAFGRGGVTETVVPLEQAGVGGELGKGSTGLFFSEQSVDALIEAVGRFEAAADQFDPAAIRAHVLPFNRERFQRELKAYLEACLPSR
jgi:glycosyltransferase involved in cell wall biosynthesis